MPLQDTDPTPSFGGFGLRLNFALAARVIDGPDLSDGEGTVEDFHLIDEAVQVEIETGANWRAGVADPLWSGGAAADWSYPSYLVPQLSILEYRNYSIDFIENTGIVYPGY